MNYQYIYLSFFLLGIYVDLDAQDSMMLSRSFQFEDGVYLTFEQFKNNRPAYEMDEVDMVYAVNPQTLLAQVASIRLPSEQMMDLDKVWGVCIRGRPFVQINREEVGKQLASFAGISIIGRLCFFSYQKPRAVPVEIKAYNPLTGKAFRSGTINKKEVVELGVLLDFQTGKTAGFSKGNLMKWVAPDPRVHQLVQSLDPKDGETLLRALMTFNDRNVIFVKSRG